MSVGLRRVRRSEEESGGDCWKGEYIFCRALREMAWEDCVKF